MKTIFQEIKERSNVKNLSNSNLRESQMEIKRKIADKKIELKKIREELEALEKNKELHRLKRLCILCNDEMTHGELTINYYGFTEDYLHLQCYKKLKGWIKRF